MTDGIFFSIGIVTIVATCIGYLARLWKQPLIPAYIVSGILLGPLGLGLITNQAEIRVLSEIGIAFLLFMVGLELEFKRLKDIGLVASVGGILEIALLSVAGLIVALFFDYFDLMEGVYAGLVVAFSSTMVVIKILSDKKELETLHGRIVTGILLMQDIIAIFVLSLFKGITEITLIFFIMAVLKAVILIWFTFFASKVIFPPLFKVAARSREILFMLSISVCFMFAFFADNIGDFVASFIRMLPFQVAEEVFAQVSPGFSIAIGAFLAGVSLANLPYNFEIVARVKPLRDFFSTLFFVSIGMELTVIPELRFIIPLVVFTFFVIIFKPIIILFLCNIFGYAKRTSFLAAVALAQTSEFSIIIVQQGLAFGHVSEEFFAFTIFLTVITIMISSYFIKFDKEFFQKTKNFLGPIENIGSKESFGYEEKKENYDVILVGYHRLGYSIVHTVKRLRRSIMVVDYNPDIIKKLAKEKIPCLYGDIGDVEIMERLNLNDVDIVISTIPDIRDNEFLVQRVKEIDKTTTVIVTANQIEEALDLYERGADYVILPHFLGGDHLSLMLEDLHRDMKKIINNKIKHIEELLHRKESGHDHPVRIRPKEEH